MTDEKLLRKLAQAENRTKLAENHIRYLQNKREGYMSLLDNLLHESPTIKSILERLDDLEAPNPD